jgi:hypothetical protein
MTGHAPEANDPDIARYSSEAHSKEKRQNNAGRWMNPECGYAKTNPNGKSLTTASFVAITITITMTLAGFWFPFTPGRGIGSSRLSNYSWSAHWNLTVGRAILVYSAIIRILAIICSCWRDS